MAGQKNGANHEGQSGNSVSSSNKRSAVGATRDQGGNGNLYKQPQHNNFMTIGNEKERDSRKAPEPGKPSSQQPYSHKLSTARAENHQGQGNTAVTSKQSSSQSNKYSIVRTNHATQCQTVIHNPTNHQENRISTTAAAPTSTNTSFHPSSTSNS